MRCPHCGRDSESKSSAARARAYRERYRERIERLEELVETLVAQHYGSSGRGKILDGEEKRK
jgi:hypothetical protein